MMASGRRAHGRKRGGAITAGCGRRLAGTLLALWLVLGAAAAQAAWPQVVASKDGTPISYEVRGPGETTLVLVHGWSCDARYWRAQVEALSATYRVVTLDLAGHGHSGAARSRYTMQAFGEDVQAVTEAAASGKVILIGHSMGGVVIAEAARLLPGRVQGLIGVDTLHNIEHPLTREELEQMAAPLRQDFPAGCRQFVQGMIGAGTEPALRDWILADMAAAPPAVAISALNEMMSLYVTGDAARLFEAVPLPVIAVNGDLWPIADEANRRHMASFEAVVLKGADHFLMLTRPDELNAALAQAVKDLLARPAPGDGGQ
ncbi:MAG: alpha/beta hydrolase [Thermodesulfobacteriota bacterium]